MSIQVEVVAEAVRQAVKEALRHPTYTHDQVAAIAATAVKAALTAVDEELGDGNGEQTERGN